MSSDRHQILHMRSIFTKNTGAKVTFLKIVSVFTSDSSMRFQFQLTFRYWKPPEKIPTEAILIPLVGSKVIINFQIINLNFRIIQL